MRPVLKRLATFSLTAAAAAGLVGGCSSGGDPTTGPASPAVSVTPPNYGTVGLNLAVAPNAPIDSIHYVVKRNGMALNQATDPEPFSGDIPVPGPAETSFVFSLQLPVGTGYSIDLTATWDDPDDADTNADISCTGGYSPFNIVAGSQTAVEAPMHCIDVGSGDLLVDVDVTSEVCPDLIPQYLSATPRSTTIGLPVELRTLFKSQTNLPIGYGWQVDPPTGGTITFPRTTADPVFTCTSPSPVGTPHRITVTATDGQCDDTLSVTVSCANELCGNGNAATPFTALDPGEDCDDGGTPGGCPDDCRMVCGDNTLITGPVPGYETCDFNSATNPNGTATCKNDCTTRTASCLDGFLTPPEACDPTATGTPGAATCTQTCTLPVVADMCNDGVPPGAGSALACDIPYQQPNCGQACLSIEGAACTTCLGASCNFADCETVTGNTTEAFTGGPPVGTSKKNLCRAVLDCAYRTNCTQNDPNDCYCGTSSNCASSPTGACAAEIAAGLESNSYATIQGRFSDGTYGGAVALNRVDCAKAVSCGSNATCGALP